MLVIYACVICAAIDVHFGSYGFATLFALLAIVDAVRE